MMFDDISTNTTFKSTILGPVVGGFLNCATSLKSNRSAARHGVDPDAVPVLLKWYTATRFAFPQNSVCVD